MKKEAYTKDEPKVIEGSLFFTDPPKELELNKAPKKYDLKEEFRKFYMDYSKLKKFNATSIIPYEDLISFNQHLGFLLEERPKEVIEQFKQIGRCIDFEGYQNFKQIHKLDKEDLGKLLKFRGRIKRLGKRMPRTIGLVYKCPFCETLITTPQHGRKRELPKKCSCGRRGGFIFENTQEENFQELNLEELQSDLKGGRQPQQLRVSIEGALCKRDLQGGRLIEVTGIVGKLPRYMSQKDEESNLCDFVLSVQDFTDLDKEEDEDISEEELKQIKEIANCGNPLDKLANSVVPEIFGNLPIKRAIVLQMMRGNSRKRSDGSMTNSMINILLVGDPGVAKSRTLRAAISRTPSARFVVGTKTSRVGLGAMVVKDELTGEWSLEVGNLILANESTLAVDELDKMPKEHLSELLEPMSSGIVTISKAGINATLPARTSILASSNPIRGSYNVTHPLAQQIGLDAPILNRFDLIFILLDKRNETFDSEATNYVFNLGEEKALDISVDLFRKYVSYTRKLKPKLDKSILPHIQDFYVNLRKQSSRDDAIPVNLRSVEALVKLSQAHAKLRLSDNVEIVDFNVAKEIFMSSVKELAVDAETGMLDMSRLSQKIPQSKRSKLESFYEILDDMSQEKSPLTYDEIIEKAKNKGIKNWDVHMFLDELKRNGEIFQPTNKTYSFVRKM